MKKHFTKILCTLLTIIMICTSIPIAAYATSPSCAEELTASTKIEAGGNYTISSMSALKAFKTLIEAGNNFADTTVELTKDIEMSDGTSWTAIGASRGKSYDDNSYSKMKPFSGTFDGKGYSLNDPSFVIGNARGYGMGFFGRIDNAVVKNLNVKNVSFTSNSNYGGFYGLGCIAGYATNSTVENCYVDGTPTFSLYSTTDVKYAGSIIGSASKTNIINCTSALNIDFTRSGYAVGGIVGYMSGGSIQGCINKGTVGSRAYDSNGGVGTGGIVGKLVGGTTIDRCVNEGTVNNYYPNAYTYYSYTGGIVGQVNGSGKYYITNCWNKGNVNGLCQVGGIVGLSGATNSGTYYPEYAGTVSPVEIFNCLNTGKVGRYNATKVPYGGGMVGSTHTYNGVFVENCYNQGNIQPESSTTSPARAFIGYGTTGESSYCGNLTQSRKPGDYTLAYITHSYSLNYNDGGGTTSMRPYTQCRSSAVGYSDCVSNYLAQSKEGAAAACAELNAYAAKDTDWKAVLVPDFRGFDPYNGVEVTENGKERDYVKWVYDKSGAVNNGLPYLDLEGVGYNESAAKPVEYTVTFKDGTADCEAFENQIINAVEGSKTPVPAIEMSREGFVFEGWYPELSETVTENATYTAVWLKDVNNNAIPDKYEMYIVIYRDSLHDGESFEDEVFEMIPGMEMPSFIGRLVHTGYEFIGWDSQIDEDGNIINTARWSKLPEPEINNDDNTPAEAPLNSDDNAVEPVTENEPEAPHTDDITVNKKADDKADLTKKADTQKPSEKNTNKPANEIKNDKNIKSPKTGADFNAVACIAATFITVEAIAAAVVIGKKRKELD